MRGPTILWAGPYLKFYGLWAPIAMVGAQIWSMHAEGLCMHGTGRSCFQVPVRLENETGIK